MVAAVLPSALTAAACVDALALAVPFWEVVLLSSPGGQQEISDICFASSP